MKKLTKEWLLAALIRAIKTFAQAALGMITVGVALNQINWVTVISVSSVAFIYSMLTSFATNLPEVGSDGTFIIDTTNASTDIYRLDLNSIDALADKKLLKLKVDTTTPLAQK